MAMAGGERPATRAERRGAAAAAPYAPPPYATRRYWFQALQFLAFSGAVVWLVVRGAESLHYDWQWYRVPQYFYTIYQGEVYPGPLVRGLLVTLQITALSLAASLVLGVVTAFLRLSGSVSGRIVAWGYLEAIRNTPLLVQLYVLYFVLAPVLGLDRFVAGVLSLALFEGAYISEIVRAGILAVPKEQSEAARALGLKPFLIYRLIVLPQALRIVLPAITSQAVSLVKNSAIVSVIAISDLTTAGRNIIADSFMSFEIWFTVAAVYLALTVPMSALAGVVERRLKLPGY